jgi:sporulation protein YlmC with PRC-barrel domain
MLKTELEIKEGTSVFTSDGKEVGKISRFVLDPGTNEVTHIVVQKGWLLPEDKVVPTAMVDAASDERVVLNGKVDDLNQLPPFEETHYVELTDADRNSTGPATYRYAPAYYWYPSSVNIGYPGLGLTPYGWPPVETTRNIPADTIPLKEGSAVVSSDGKHVGNVERLFIDAETNKATHFLISHGLLFKDRKLVPAHWIKSVEEDKIHLTVPSRLLERLPSYQS